MTALMVLTFIAFLWIAHGFWCDYKEAHRPLTKEEQELLFQQLQKLELELFHKRLHLVVDSQTDYHSTLTADDIKTTKTPGEILDELVRNKKD